MTEIDRLKQEIVVLKQELIKYKHDNLTGLLTRHTYKDNLTKLWYDIINSDTTITYAYLDINYLHNINNKYGHNIGDKYICALTNKLKTMFDNDTIYRIGGDEFSIITTGDTKDSIATKLDSISVVSFEYGITVIDKDSDFNSIEEFINITDSIVINKKMKKDRRRN